MSLSKYTEDAQRQNATRADTVAANAEGSAARWAASRGTNNSAFLAH